MRTYLLICILACFIPAQANLINNGSFELGTFVDDGNGTDSFNAGPTTITGWTAVGRQVSWIQSPNPWGLSAQDGNHFLDLTGYATGAPFGGVTQTFATIVGQQYDLSFYLGSYTQRWGGPPISILAAAANTNQTFTVSTTSTASTWTPFSMPFTASSANTTITLTGAAGVEYIGLDSVTVDAVSAVPEPESATLIVLGLGAFGSIIRLRNPKVTKL
jgi:hypothetical protein